MLSNKTTDNIQIKTEPKKEKKKSYAFCTQLKHNCHTY